MRADKKNRCTEEGNMEQDFKLAFAFIVSDNKLDRSSWKKVLIQLGLAPEKILFFKNFELATHHLEKELPRIVMLADQIKEVSAYRFLQAYHSKTCERSQTMRFLMADEDNDVVKFLSAQYCIDNTLIRPYSFDQLHSGVKKIFELKASGYGVNESEGFMICKKAGQALAQKNYRQACELFEQGIDRCMGDDHKRDYLFQTQYIRSLYETKQFIQAKREMDYLLDHFFLPPQLIKIYVKLSIAAKDHEEMLGRLINSHELFELMPEVKDEVAAGMAIGARFVLESNAELALAASLKAIKIANHRPIIVMNALNNLCDLGAYEIAKAQFEDFHGRDDLRPIMDMVELRILEAGDAKSFELFKKGMDLVNQGFHHVHVYSILLKAGVAAQRKKELLCEIAENAAQKFPEKESYFFSLVG